MIRLITSIEQLPSALGAAVTPEEKQYLNTIKGLPFAVTAHFASLACPEPDDPIRRQFFPDPREAVPDPFALDDPLGEYRYRVAPRLVHQYRDRALLLSAQTCAGYCRHCFRRVWLTSGCDAAATTAAPEKLPTGSANGAPSAQPHNFQAEMAYLAAHPKVREILVSGGDPLTLDNGRLNDLFCQLRTARADIMLRVCTRIPITEPLRLDSETVALFARFRPLRLAVHINHPRELSAPACAALAACVSAGIPVHVQTVLMKGINDDPALLAQLFRSCLDLGLLPYYLFQMDLAPGTAHFRVPLKRGLAIYRELGEMISGLGLPAYAVDLPGGGGKLRLHENVIAGEQTTAAGQVYILKDSSGGEWQYPAE